MRRLITLISAGRNRTIVIRRELPRTRSASSGTRPYRIKHRRVLLAVSPSPATGAAVRTCKSLFSGSLPLRLRFGCEGNGPRKAQQFTGNSSHDLRFIFAGGREFFVAPVARFQDATRVVRRGHQVGDRHHSDVENGASGHDHLRVTRRGRPSNFGLMRAEGKPGEPSRRSAGPFGVTAGRLE